MRACLPDAKRKVSRLCRLASGLTISNDSANRANNPLQLTGSNKFNPKEPVKYRPISILPAFSKILEKLASIRLIHFLESQDITKTGFQQFSIHGKKSTYLRGSHRALSWDHFLFFLIYVKYFYGKLQDLIDTVPRGDVLIIMGDWNANIGDKAVEGVSGTHGLGDRNEAGERMIEFCEENQLIVTNTWYKQPRRRLYTWTTPNGLHRNQIDYIMIQKRWRSMVKSAKTMPGADCGTDHELLVAIIQVKLKKTKKPEIENRYNLCDIPERYAVEVKNRFAA